MVWLTYAPPETDLFILLDSGTPVSEWEGLHFTMKGGTFSDYLANNHAARLCSAKMRKILDHMKSEIDELQWLPVIVENENGEQRQYFILHFPITYDVLNEKESIFGAYNSIIKPVISQSKAHGHNIFTFHGAAQLSFRISEPVKVEIQKEKCTGMEFERVVISD